MSASSSEAWSGLRAFSNGSSVSIDTTFSRNASNRGQLGEDFADRNSSGLPGECLPSTWRTSGQIFGRRRTSCPHGGRRFPSGLPGRGRLGIASGRRTHRSEGWRRSPIRSDAFEPSGVKKSWAAADPGRHPGAPPDEAGWGMPRRRHNRAHRTRSGTKSKSCCIAFFAFYVEILL